SLGNLPSCQCPLSYRPTSHAPRRSGAAPLAPRQGPTTTTSPRSWTSFSEPTTAPTTSQSISCSRNPLPERTWATWLSLCCPADPKQPGSGRKPQPGPPPLSDAAHQKDICR